MVVCGVSRRSVVFATAPSRSLCVSWVIDENFTVTDMNLDHVFYVISYVGYRDMMCFQSQPPHCIVPVIPDMAVIVMYVGLTGSLFLPRGTNFPFPR